MLNGPLRDIGVLLAVYDETKNRCAGGLYLQQDGDGAALRRLKHCAPYPLVEEIQPQTEQEKLSQRWHKTKFWRTTPYASHWLRGFQSYVLDPKWWDKVGCWARM